MVVALVKGLMDAINANGVFVVVVGDVAVLGILVVVVFVTLSKGLGIAIMLPLHSCMVAQPIPSPLHHARVSWLVVA